jgi:PncC family amidohydrolase
MVALAEGKVIAASPLGKLKTVFQIIAVVTLIVKDSLVTIWGIWFGGDGGSLAWIMNILAWTVMAITLIITIGSLVDYFINSAEVLGFEYSGRWARKTVLDELDDGGEKSDGGGASELGGELSDGRGAGELGGELSGELNHLDGDLHINELSTAILKLAREKSLTIATAESCTGGLVAAALTDIPGSSDVFNGSIVSYANSIKQGLLSVPESILTTDGAVSESCVRQMATSACQTLKSDFAVATSGIAGPDGGTNDKPVGTVWLAVAGPDGAVSRCELFTGNRSQIRQQAVSVVLQMLYQALTEA